MMRACIFICSSSFLWMACAPKPEILKAKTPAAPAVQQIPFGSQTGVDVRFKNATGEVRVRLDPSEEDVYLDFKSSPNRSNSDSAKASQSFALSPQNQPIGTAPGAAGANDTIVKADTIQVDSLVWKNLKGVESAAAREAFSNVQEAQALFYKKDWDGALAKLDQSIKVFPTAEAYALLGSVQLRKGNRIQAKHFWQKSLEIDPNQAKVKQALQGLGGKE
jgi:tetratricopeptide (TPR) repeat protein